ncbi:class I SAM-dependent methyltransferase [Cryptosporangium phraense]|uniref:Class I SAM-dependent methyltransferase n=1 Tax=Cryptosporangium phraense TaxID=2593070 RepID=A0A545APB9_9ACTN|nr:class I SAM-dependent methyltransferase [Cryptosporangium phraense]TQS43146.1 class I SAM-dependent methyltransferase [Cryptosporangium phraense]
MTSTRATVDHYERLAASHDHNWTHSGVFLDWMTSQIVSAASIGATDRVADVGSGTGLFARHIADQVHPAQPILCVDTSRPMLTQIPTSPEPQPVVAPAEEMAEWVTAGGGAGTAGELDVILLKESVHTR